MERKVYVFGEGSFCTAVVTDFESKTKTEKIIHKFSLEDEGRVARMINVLGIKAEHYKFSLPPQHLGLELLEAATLEKEREYNFRRKSFPHSLRAYLENVKNGVYRP